MTTKWNAKIQFPTTSDTVNRCIGATFGPSKSSQNPMISLEFEVVSPEVVEVGYLQVNIQGVKCINYYTTKVFEKDTEGNSVVNEDKTAACLERVHELYANFGIDTTGVNWDNPPVDGFRGKCVMTQMSPDVDVMRKNPTSQQIRDAKKKGIRAEGDIMKNPVTGKDLIQYWPKIREIFGLAQTEHIKMTY